MNLKLYKPNPKNTGCAMSFQISQKENQEPQFFANCILQHSWNSKNRTGSFTENKNDPSKKVALKFNEFELGEFINTFTNHSPYSTFHSNESTKTQIRLTTYEKNRGTGDYAVKVTAFGLTIVRNGSDTFKIPIDPGEAVRLISFIKNYFNLLDSYRAEEQKENQKKYLKQNTKSTPKSTSKVKTKEVDNSEDDELEF